MKPESNKYSKISPRNGVSILHPERSEGWNNPTLALIDGMYVIYSDKKIAFVPLSAAPQWLLDRCEGVEELLNEFF